MFFIILLMTVLQFDLFMIMKILINTIFSIYYKQRTLLKLKIYRYLPNVSTASPILKLIFCSTPASFHTGLPTSGYSSETSHATTIPSSGIDSAHDKLLNPVYTPVKIISRTK